MGMGLMSVAADLGIRYNIELLTDATAVTGIARRLGICKLRHLDTSLLWIQQTVRDKEVLPTNVLGKENPGDRFTTYLSGPEIQAHLSRMGLGHEEGRAGPARTL